MGCQSGSATGGGDGEPSETLDTSSENIGRVLATQLADFPCVLAYEQLGMKVIKLTLDKKLKSKTWQLFFKSQEPERIQIFKKDKLMCQLKMGEK